MAKAICRLLIALMIWMPYQVATAGMIASDQVTVLSFLSRPDVARELQALGIDPSTAQDRVAAMSDQEAQSLAGQINARPAGGMASGAGVLLIVIIAAALWWFYSQR